MHAKILCTLALAFALVSGIAQATYLRINPNIVLPKDTVESRALIRSLSDFLLAAQKPNEENKLVFENEKVETFVLLDEVNGIEKSSKHKDENFYKPYLINAVLLPDKRYLVQVSYIGINENLAYLKANFEFIAHRAGNSFTFSSPLVRNTAAWKVKKVDNNIFHYQTTINKDKLKEYNKLTSLFDSKLKVAGKVTEFYCTDNIVEMQKLIGVMYKADYNGQQESVWSSSFGDRKLIVLGNSNSTFNQFDPHDLFHDRLSLVIPRSKVNKSVDEGCAYIYGGSWGFTWKEIFKAFKEQVASNRSTNWMEVKEKPVSFKIGNFPNSADYIVNALLVKKIEKEKGFDGVMELLKLGPSEKGNEKYYQALEKLTGITKATYNENVWQLINNEK